MNIEQRVPEEIKEGIPAIEELVELQIRFPRAIYPSWNHNKKRFEGYRGECIGNNGISIKLNGKATPIGIPEVLSYFPAIKYDGSITTSMGCLPCRPVQLSLENGTGRKTYYLTWNEAEFLAYPEIWGEFECSSFEMPLRVAEDIFNWRRHHIANAYSYGDISHGTRGKLTQIPIQYYHISQAAKKQMIEAISKPNSLLLEKIKEENGREAKFLKLPQKTQKRWLDCFYAGWDKDISQEERDRADKTREDIEKLFLEQGERK